MWETPGSCRLPEDLKANKEYYPRYKYGLLASLFKSAAEEWYPGVRWMFTDNSLENFDDSLEDSDSAWYIGLLDDGKIRFSFLPRSVFAWKSDFYRDDLTVDRVAAGAQRTGVMRHLHSLEAHIDEAIRVCRLAYAEEDFNIQTSPQFQKLKKQCQEIDTVQLTRYP